MGNGQIEIAVCDVLRIARVGKAHLFWESVGIQPINQPLAPGCDDGGLWIMHMGVDETCRNQSVTVVCDVGTWICRAQIGGFTHCHDAPHVNQNATMAQMARGSWAYFKWITFKGKNLPQHQIGHLHFLFFQSSTLP